MKTLYEVYSLIVGVSAIATLTGFMFGSIFLKDFLFCLNEPILWVSIIEMILGITTIPYYFFRCRNIRKEMEG